MKQQLYPHNKAAYDKVIAAFETSQKTCICHPTGTGKSYIVAAVCQHFDKVLILAPNIFVLKQQEEVLKWHNNVSYMTYPGLMVNYHNIQEQYDLIVLDEFHRAGADEWGAAVNLLLESQAQAKVLGTSATPIRYLDNKRDMAQELFNNNVASTLTIAEAWSQNILPIPTYVTGFFSFDKTIEDAIQKINRSQKINKQEKRSRIFRFNNMRLEWEKSYGMVSILQKHLGKEIDRIIIFCAHIEALKNMQSVVKKWFQQAGFYISGTYSVYSGQSENEQSKQMRLFSTNTSKGVKLMFSVNVLNEGVHIPNVDAVIMLRTTSSKIIYLQQLGRCLTAANSDKPIVLDMVDNITTTMSIKSIATEFEQLEFLRANKEGRTPRSFEVFDYTLDVQQMIDKLVPGFKSFEERVSLLEDYYKKHQCLPSGSKYLKGEDRKMGIMWMYMKADESDNPIVQKYIQIEQEYWKQKKENKIRDVENFIKTHKRYPRDTVAEEKYLSNAWHDFKASNPKHPIVIELVKEYGPKAKNRKHVQKVLSEVTAFCEEHGYMPRGTKEDYVVYRRWIELLRTHSQEAEVQGLVTKYPKYSYAVEGVKNTIKAWKDYKKQNGYFPGPHQVFIYNSWKRIQSKYGHLPEVQKFIQEIERERELEHEQAITRRANEYLYFYKKTGHLINVGDKKAEGRMYHLIKNHPENKAVQELIKVKQLLKEKGVTIRMVE